MTLQELVDKVKNKDRFLSLDHYLDYAEQYLSFIRDNLQAVIVSRKETNYRFFQYNQDGGFNVTRPINSNLMYSIERFSIMKKEFLYGLLHIHDIKEDAERRKVLNNMVYTCQQCIGATLDALPAGKSNVARKINGDLFERLVREILRTIGIDVKDGIVEVPITENGNILFTMNYQHDLIVQRNSSIVAIGSVKTSSKDRLDKIFMDKFLYNRLTGSNTPHFAVFLNDVQRKGMEPNFSINTTFLTGHFKGYTIKLNPLDGVYYCDLRPNMISDPLLQEHIKTFDNLLTTDIWKFME